MLDSDGGRDGGSPGMSEDDGLRYTELYKGMRDQVGLRVGCPQFAAWSVAVTEAWPIERDDAVILRREIDETARFKVLKHAAIAMKQYDSVADTSLGVVEPDVTYLDETANRWVVPFGLSR